jgi:uncharacterized protein (TIGR00369 family)
MSTELNITAFDKTLGVNILESKPRYAKLSLPFQENLTNPYGSLHGGVISTLIDTAMAVAVFSTFPGSLFYTRKLDIKFVSQAEKNTIFAEARIVNQKKHFVFGKVLVKDGAGRLIAQALATFVLNNKQD